MAPHAEQNAAGYDELLPLAERFECEPDETWWSSGYTVRYVVEKALAAMDLAARDQSIGIDFADMIFLPLRNGWLQKLYDAVIVDEAQDMTAAQLELALGLCRGRVIIVGDDRQAIYGFRGADSDSLHRLQRHLNAKVFPMTVTFRCGAAIVAEAQRLVPDLECGPHNPAGLITELGVERLSEVADRGDFILSRLNAPLVPIAMSLLRNGKRARIAGKDIGAGLKALLRKLCGRRGCASVEDFLERLATWEQRETEKFRAAQRPDRVDQVHDKAEMIIGLADGVDSVDDLIARIDALFTDDGLGAQGVITCSSVHKAKGLEANRVFVLRDTLYPRGRTSREEENIEYVAITRAKQELVWVSAVGPVEVVR